MSNKKINSRAPSTQNFLGFSNSAASVVNFRFLKGGGLETRCGARFLFNLNQPIRTLWSGVLHGHPVTYFLAGSIVYSADIARGIATAIGGIQSSEGDANFFCLQGRLYLTDGGESVYLIEKDEIRSALGYVPLLGKDWDPNLMGEICEPLNLLNPHARITYVLTEASSFLKVPKAMASIEAIYRNGTLLAEDQYEINNYFSSIEVSGLKSGDRLEVYLTFEESEERKDLRTLFCSMRGSIFFCSGEKSRTFFFDSEGSDMMFCTRYVATESLLQGQKHYDADPLYLPEGYEFRVGDGTYPVRGAICHHDSLLIFTEKDTWAATADSTGLSLLPTVPVNAELGCVASNACVLSPNDPVTISRHGLYRWESPDPEETHRDAVRISGALDEILSPSDLRQSTLFYDALREELWLNVIPRQEMWIYSPEQGDWFCFTGLQADHLFDADGNVAFTRGSQVFVMDPTIYYDIDANNEAQPIHAVFESKAFDFGSVKPKNLSQIHSVGYIESDKLRVELCCDDTENVSCELSNPQLKKKGIFSHRLRSGRFRSATLRLSTETSTRIAVYVMQLIAH